MANPCSGSFSGRTLHEPCDECHHPLMVHTIDKLCGLCEAIDEFKAELGLDDTEYGRLARALDPAIRL